MREPGQKTERVAITYFEGVNGSVQHAIARRTELAHMENARAPMIGVLEKREGQALLGTDSNGATFASEGNFGITHFNNENTAFPNNQGLIRVTTVDGSTASLFLLDVDDKWQVLTATGATGLSNAIADFANADGNLIMVNGVDANRIIDKTLSTITTAQQAGSMYNSPVANKVAFYKSRIYLADYVVGEAQIPYNTTILRSSYPMGVISLVNGDVATDDGSGNWTIPVTDSKYFYTATGMNSYEVYRGNTKIATLTLTTITETNIVATVSFEGSFSSFLSADEIWIATTFTGEKQYRWINNASTIGRDVKQYDTFKLVGGDESGVTMLESIGNILLIANATTMMTWNDYNLENFNLGVGCSSKKGYVKLRGSVYFLDYSGIYSTTGTTPQLISRKVERYIKGMSRAGFQNAAAGSKGLSAFWCIGDVDLFNNDGSAWKTLPGVCLEFNVADQNWYVHTNVYATEFQNFLGTTGQERLAMCSLTDGQSVIYGSELIFNGSFSGNADGWTLGSHWSYGTNNVSYNND